MELEKFRDSIDEARVDTARQKLRVREHVLEEGDVVFHTSDAELVQSALQLLGRLLVVSRLACNPSNQHTVVMPCRRRGVARAAVRFRTGHLHQEGIVVG